MFTEHETRSYYNRSDSLYRSLWDKEGNCHWGYFPNDDVSFARSMVEQNKKMLRHAGIGPGSNVLDLGCGNGNNSFFIAKETGARVTGIDLSDVRVANAKAARRTSKPAIRRTVRFLRASATELPFKNAAFTHIWSQATIYHVHDKHRALSEVARVLKKGGVFVFDDLIRPNKRIRKSSKTLLYDRLLFETHLNLTTYQMELNKLGFRVLYAEDISRHFAMSYWKLADIAEKKMKEGLDPSFHQEYRTLVHAYRATWNIVDRGDAGWALFAVKKI